MWLKVAKTDSEIELEQEQEFDTQNLNLVVNVMDPKNGNNANPTNMNMNMNDDNGSPGVLNFDPTFNYTPLNKNDKIAMNPYLHNNTQNLNSIHQTQTQSHSQDFMYTQQDFNPDMIFESYETTEFYENDMTTDKVYNKTNQFNFEEFKNQQEFK
eukprot:CAMPEP_0116936050 /NCGR_PEP_ID=MMETSP0467-20121206/30649_1 /TAXON_ID=283647 /ORGANISM="Mesodinium pulex, Strain SPMC105" /LENGTH=154 /DNA_ID=CAMNT_0004617543 /DNA_START=833 /DNA_END=1297 /DNA_ORIENTATION=+